MYLSMTLWCKSSDAGSLDPEDSLEVILFKEKVKVLFGKEEKKQTIKYIDVSKLYSKNDYNEIK